MARAVDLAGHLPTLWRPGTDGEGPVVPFGPADIVAVVPVSPRPGAPVPVAEVLARDPGVLVRFDRGGWPSRVRFRPGLAPGPTLVLEVRRVTGGQPETVPIATVAVRDGVAVVPRGPDVDRVTLVLRRRHLLDRWVQGVGAALDGASDRIIEVMEGHWVDTADAGLHSPWLLRRRQLGGELPLDPTNPDDQAVLAAFPYIRDLARVGSLLPLEPWREPPAVVDLVEGYRERIRRTIDLYRQGLATLPAMRRAVAARLPLDPTVAEVDRDPSFTVEEFSPSVLPAAVAVAADGPPTDLVGPLMRWSLEAEGLAAAAPTVHVGGVAPIAGEVDATEQPGIELLAAGGQRRRVALAWRGTVPPDQTLRLAPTCRTWVVGDDGLQVTEPPVDPEAGVAGPWVPAPGAPADVVAVAVSFDQALWAATATAGATSSLWRHDGTDWVEQVAELAPVTAMAATDADLVVATTAGLLRVDLHPVGGGPPAPMPEPATLADPAVHALLVEDDGTVLVGGEDGLARLHGDGSAEAVAPDDDPTRLGVVRALAHDASGSLLVGGDDGLFLHQSGLGHWYAFSGERVTETAGDWVRLDGGGAAVDDPGLPPVRALLRGPDASLWLGTAAGLARYRAVPMGDGALTSTTLLEAFPDLGIGAVDALAVDARGLVWAATARGLVSFDGRDFAQVAADGAVTPLGRADRVLPDDAPEDRGAWRFDRDGGAWQQWGRGGFHTTTLDVRSAALPAVRALVVVDGVAADLLEDWDPVSGQASATTPVDGAELVVRIKPGDDTRVVTGGIPALPRVPVGVSTWRYLALEPVDALEPEARPAWTVEGRLLPPPTDRDPAGEGRFDRLDPVPERTFDETVFAFRPAARVWMSWRTRRPLTVLVRLPRGNPMDPVVLDRVWDGIERARPAGVRVALAVGNDIVRGGV